MSALLDALTLLADMRVYSALSIGFSDLSILTS